jgi:hypothetical protein
MENNDLDRENRKHEREFPHEALSRRHSEVWIKDAMMS